MGQCKNLKIKERPSLADHFVLELTLGFVGQGQGE